jgi:ribosome-associated heat shock protein Hsp15
VPIPDAGRYHVAHPAADAARHRRDRGPPREGGRDDRDAFPTRAILGRVTDPRATDETRIDRWLCAVRLVKTRPLATQLCDGGHVLVNGSPAKPSTRVRAGDRVEARIADRDRVVEVVRPIESRVGAPVAATCYVDHSPPPVVTEVRPGIMAVRGEGRPSKRLRRELERLRRAADA